MTTTPNDKDTPESLPFTTFLESTPPEAEQTISDLFTSSARNPYGEPLWTVNSPDRFVRLLPASG